MFAAFRFFAHDSACTAPTTAYTTPTIDFGLATGVQQAIAMQLQNWMAPDTAALPDALNLQEAMRTDVGGYADIAQFTAGRGAAFNTQALMVFVNRISDSTTTDAMPPNVFDDCSPPVGSATTAQQALVAEAASAFTNSGIQTDFVVLDDDNRDGESSTVPFYDGVAQAVNTQVNATAATVLDATSSDPSTVLLNFANVATQLGTCIYDVPTGATTGGSVAYVTPTFGTIPVPLDTTCTANSTTANGWNIDSTGRLVICGSPCSQLRQIVLQVTAAALMANQTAPDVPVTITAPCPAGADGGT